jgi:deazaflavin-dependent oxidoreductase (nitroreductase family)
MPQFAKTILGVMPRLYRLLNGRGMGPTLILTTVGAKSGRKREVHLTAFREGDGWLVVGSRGGSTGHPAWYLNMARHPDEVWVQVGSRFTRVKTETLKGDARAKAWQRIVSKYSTYSAYQRSTDREIPVIRLTPVA